MSTPSPEEPQRQRVSTDSDAGSPRSHIGSILWILLLVALIAIGIWWYSQETEVLVPQPPTAVEDPLPATYRPVAPVAPVGVEAPVARKSAGAVTKPDQPKAVPKPVASVQRDRGPVPLPTNRKPEYPSRALRSGVQGSVSVLIEINAQGVPTDVRVVSRRGERSRDLDQAVVSAARDWRFDPARRDGRPVPGEVILPVDFERN